MKVRMDFAPGVERLPKAIEITLFRVLQESLTNVHRHSGTSEVDIHFRREADTVILEVRDYGRGMQAERLGHTGPAIQDVGVGLAGMRERLNDLQGGLEIELAAPGTRVRPLRLCSPGCTRLRRMTLSPGKNFLLPGLNSRCPAKPSKPLIRSYRNF